MAIVSIKSQQVTFYDADGWILRAPVSTGTTGRETPAGVFAVLEKNKEHHLSLYDDASMPNMLRITWNGIALHGGPLPGYAASHGCIRMPFDFAEKVFDKAPMGMRVIISPTDSEPVAFSDPALFVPKQDAIDAAPALAAAAARDADDAAKAATAAKAAVAPAKRAAAAAPAAVRNLTSLKARADAELAHIEKALAAANANPKMTDQAKPAAQTAAQDAQQKAAAKAQALGEQLDTAKADLKAKQDAAAAAEAAAKATAAKRVETASAATAAKLAGVPVSIYISRATQKLYVRRDTHKNGRTAASCTTSARNSRSPSRTRTSRSARTSSPRWRATAAVCAGPRFRSTTATTPRTRSTASPSRRKCSTRSRRRRCHCPRSSSRTSRCRARPTIAPNSSRS